MDCKNKKCPAYAKCLAPYRGSRCKATRATYGLGDPLTNADCIRAMTDKELAEFISGKARTFGEEYEGYMSALDWLKQEASE